MGLSYTGINCLLTACVTGYKRVPEPPAKIMPFLVLCGFVLIMIILVSTHPKSDQHLAAILAIAFQMCFLIFLRLSGSSMA